MIRKVEAHEFLNQETWQILFFWRQSICLSIFPRPGLTQLLFPVSVIRASAGRKDEASIKAGPHCFSSPLFLPQILLGVLAWAVKFRWIRMWSARDSNRGTTGSLSCSICGETSSLQRPPVILINVISGCLLLRWLRCFSCMAPLSLLYLSAVWSCWRISGAGWERWWWGPPLWYTWSSGPPEDLRPCDWR